MSGDRICGLLMTAVARRLQAASRAEGLTPDPTTMRYAASQLIVGISAGKDPQVIDVLRGMEPSDPPGMRTIEDLVVQFRAGAA